MCRRGEIYYVNFGKKRGSNKQEGIRPVVIVSNNYANRFSPIITVVPLTTKIYKKQKQPTHVQILPEAQIGLKKSSMALAEQVETIDKGMLMDKKGEIIDPSVMRQITRAIQIQIGVFDQFN